MVEDADVHDILSAWQEACQASPQFVNTTEWADAEVEQYSIDLGEGAKFCICSRYHDGSMANIFDNVIQLRADILCIQIEHWIPSISEGDVNGVLNKFGVKALLNHD